MRSLSSVAVVAILALSGPALAQARPQAAPDAPQQAAPPAADEDSDAEAAFEAKGEAFGKSMETMASEMQAAAAQGDKAKAKTDLDALQARYQIETDVFAAEMQTCAAAQGVPADQMAAAATQIKSIPAMVRAQVEQAAAAPAPAPAQPQ